MGFKQALSVFVIFLIFLLTLLSLSAVNPQKVNASGSLLGYWKFDETVAGSTAVDSSGAGSDGNPINSPTPSTDVPSEITFSDPRSISLNGSDQYIQIPDNYNQTLTDATFSTWVKFNDVGGGDQDFLAKRNSGGVEYQFGKAGGNSLKVTFATGGSSCCHDFNYTPSPSLTNGQWYNFAVTINQTTHELKWYISGSLKQTDNITGFNLGTNTTANLSLGSSYDGTGEFLNGNIDEMRIYNRALLDSEIADIAAGESGPDATPTPTPSPASSSSSNNSPAVYHPPSSTNPPICSDTIPNGVPDLFEVDSAGTYANLYFTTANNRHKYNINYGLTPDANQYGDSFGYSGNEWTIGRTINNLWPNTTYYFKVQAVNGCTAGPWSKTVQIKTKSKLSSISQWFANLSL